MQVLHAEEGIRECIGAASLNYPVMDMEKAIEKVLCVPRVVTCACMAHRAWYGTLIRPQMQARGVEQQPAQQRLA